jgi:hypothetical protein
MTERTFYVYGLYDENSILRYIGKGNSYYDRTRRHFRKSSNPKVREFINDKWRVEFMFKDKSEKDVLDKERELILEHKPTLYNMSKGGEGGLTRDGEGNPITLKNIKTGEIKYFKTQAMASRFIGVDPNMITLLKGNKVLHIKRIWVLEHMDGVYALEESKRKSGYKVPKLYKKVRLYDNLERKFLYFNSQKECAKFLHVSTGNVTRLIQGEFFSLKKYRYTIKPDDLGIRTRKCSVIDTTNDKVFTANSYRELATILNVKECMVSCLFNGRVKSMYKKYQIYEPNSLEES